MSQTLNAAVSQSLADVLMQPQIERLYYLVPVDLAGRAIWTGATLMPNPIQAAQQASMKNNSLGRVAYTVGLIQRSVVEVAE